MKPAETEESVSTVYTDDENFDEDSTFETSLEILYGTECDVDPSTIQENIIDTIKHTIDENVAGRDIIQTNSEIPNEDEGNPEHQDDDVIEGMEKKFQNAVQNLAEELNMATQVIKEEKEQIEKELQSYKELREMYDKISKDFEGGVVIKPKSITSHQDVGKQCRQDENFRHTTSTPMLMKSTAEFSMSAMSPVNPWFYSKYLQDAEKFCNQQMERVRRCISVSSMNAHAADSGLHNPSRCVGEPSLDTHQDVTGDSIERRANSKGDANSKRNLNTFSWRQQLLSSKHVEKRFVGSMERGDGGDEDTTYCMWPTTGSNQINGTGDPCVHH